MDTNWRKLSRDAAMQLPEIQALQILRFFSEDGRLTQESDSSGCMV